MGCNPNSHSQMNQWKCFFFSFLFSLKIWIFIMLIIQFREKMNLKRHSIQRNELCIMTTTQQNSSTTSASNEEFSVYNNDVTLSEPQSHSNTECWTEMEWEVPIRAHKKSGHQLILGHIRHEYTNNTHTHIYIHTQLDWMHNYVKSIRKLYEQQT